MVKLNRLLSLCIYMHVRDVTMRTKDVIPTIEIKEGDADVHTSSIMYILMLHVYARVSHVRKKKAHKCCTGDENSIDDAYHFDHGKNRRKRKRSEKIKRTNIHESVTAGRCIYYYYDCCDKCVRIHALRLLSERTLEH